MSFCNTFPSVGLFQVICDFYKCHEGPFSVFVPRRLQVSMLQLCMQTFEPGLTFKLFVMSQTMHVGLPLKIRFFYWHKESVHFQQRHVKTVFQCKNFFRIEDQVQLMEQEVTHIFQWRDALSSKKKCALNKRYATKGKRTICFAFESFRLLTSLLTCYISHQYGLLF